MSALLPLADVTMIARCPVRGCRTTTRRQVLVDDAGRIRLYVGRPEDDAWVYYPARPQARDPRADWACPKETLGWVLSRLAHRASMICLAHARYLVCRPLVATRTGTRCTSSCRTATAHTCRCDCSGRQHATEWAR